MVFGSGTGFGIVMIKMFIDQFVFTPILHIPVIQLSLLFGQCRCSWVEFSGIIEERAMLTPHGLLAGWWFPALLPTWLVWVPAVSVVYGLPDALQIVVFAIIMCFWSILQMAIAAGPPDPPAVETKAAPGN